LNGLTLALSGGKKVRSPTAGRGQIACGWQKSERLRLPEVRTPAAGKDQRPEKQRLKQKFRCE